PRRQKRPVNLRSAQQRAPPATRRGQSRHQVGRRRVAELQPTRNRLRRVIRRRTRPHDPLQSVAPGLARVALRAHPTVTLAAHDPCVATGHRLAKPRFVGRRRKIVTRLVVPGDASVQRLRRQEGDPHAAHVAPPGPPRKPRGPGLLFWVLLIRSFPVRCALLSMKLHIAGHQGMVGSALVRRFQNEPGVELVLRTRRELDLTDQAAVRAFYAEQKPDATIIAAAKVGGIHANNTFPAEFIFDNLNVATATIDGAWRAGVRRLLFLGSSCIYPKHAPQPMPEECLLSGPLEPTNEAYAIAKIAGLKLAQYYRKQYGVCYHSAMPTNLYGPGDNYHP